MKRGTLSSKKGRAWIKSVGHEAGRYPSWVREYAEGEGGSTKGVWGLVQRGVGGGQTSKGGWGVVGHDPILVKWQKRKLLISRIKFFFSFF